MIAPPLARQEEEAATPEVLRRAWEGDPAPPLSLVVAMGALALLTVLYRRLWPRARHVITIAHEGGHAFAALATGRRLAGVRLHSDTSGVTVSSGRPTGPGVVATVAAGYLTPSLLGLGAAALASTGRVSLLLQLCVALLLAMLVVIRNGFGALSVLASMAVFLSVSWFAPETVQGGFAAYVAWFLLFGGLRPVVEVQRHRRQGRAWDSDPDQLARLTRMPAAVWVGFFGVGCLGCLVGGAGLLLAAA